jgi:hypothetical protein
MSQDRYNQTETNQILQRALTRQLEQQDTTSREELIESASEIGISASELEAAAAEIATEHQPPNSQSRGVLMLKGVGYILGALSVLNIMTLATGLSPTLWVLPYSFFVFPPLVTILVEWVQKKQKKRQARPALPIIERHNLNSDEIPEEVTVGASSETLPRR